MPYENPEPTPPISPLVIEDSVGDTLTLTVDIDLTFIAISPPKYGVDHYVELDVEQLKALHSWLTDRLEEIS